MSHRNLIRPALATIALAAAVSFAGAASAQDSARPAAPAGVRGEIMTWIRDAEDKLVRLADAMPEGKYNWNPDKGVRTVGEVFMHVAAANYGIASFVGVAPPAGFNLETYEHSLTRKGEIVKALKESFAHVEAGLTGMPDADLEKPAEFFGMKTTARGAYLLLLSHAHEHLGQSIAYARSNKVTPPWTARRQAAQEKAVKK